MILNSRVVIFARQREITGEPLNSRSRILAPNRREITGFDCIWHLFVGELLFGASDRDDMVFCLDHDFSGPSKYMHCLCTECSTRLPHADLFTKKIICICI